MGVFKLHNLVCLFVCLGFDSSNISSNMPLSFKNVFQVMNNNDNDPRFDAEEILNEFASHRNPPQESSTPERRLSSRSSIISPDISNKLNFSDISDPGTDHNLSISNDSDFSYNSERNVYSVELGTDQDIGQTFVLDDQTSGVPTENEDVQNVVADRPLPVLLPEKGSKSS